MNHYRITKYNPALRDEQGKFLGEGWTGFRDVGKLVGHHEYKRVETAYVQTAIKILTDQRITTIEVQGLESSMSSAPVKEGQALNTSELEPIIRAILRDEYWARLEAATAFVHFGWDFYMYIGVGQISEDACVFAYQQGLYIEPFCSPYWQEKQ